MAFAVVHSFFAWRQAAIDNMESAERTTTLNKIALAVGVSPKEEASSIVREIQKLKAAVRADVWYSPPIIQKREGGAFLVRSEMHIRSTTPRSGLTIGITAEKYLRFAVLRTTEGRVNYGPYTNPNAWTDLGEHRFHFRDVSGAYLIEIEVGALAPITIKSILEGNEAKGAQIITWKISGP